MNFRQTIIIMVVVGVLMAGIDLVWIVLVANNFYNQQLGSLLNGVPVMWAAAAFYLIYTGALAYFAVGPALRAGSVKVGLLNGAGLGFVAYATYDLTNMATLQGWPIVLVPVDMAWGTVLSASVAGLSYVVIKSTYIQKYFGKAA